MRAMCGYYSQWCCLRANPDVVVVVERRKRAAAAAAAANGIKIVTVLNGRNGEGS